MNGPLRVRKFTVDEIPDEALDAIVENPTGAMLRWDTPEQVRALAVAELERRRARRGDG